MLKKFTMKMFIRYALSLCIGTMLFSACDEVVTYNDGYDDGLTPYGPPVIARITTVADTETDISTGSFNQMIVLHGENLSQVQSLVFNDQEVDLKEIYAVNDRITVRVPGTVPDQIDDKVKLRTSKGEVAFDFKVAFPDLVIAGLSHHFASAGEQVQLLGENLKLYDFTPEKGQLTIGGKKAAIVACEENVLTFTVPDGVGDNSPLILSSERMKTVTGLEEVELTYRDRGYSVLDMFADNFEALTTNDQGVSYATQGGAGGPAPLFPGAWFCRFNAVSGAYKWNYLVWQSKYQFSLPNADALCAEILKDLSAFDFRYEILVPAEKPIAGTNHRVMVFLGRRPADANLEWLPAASGTAYHTQGRWATVSMSGSDYLNPDGSTPLKEHGNPFGIAYITGGTDLDLDVSFTNFRICKKMSRRISQK